MEHTLETRRFFSPEQIGATIIKQYAKSVLKKSFKMKFNRHDLYFAPLAEYEQSYIIRNKKAHNMKLHTTIVEENISYFVCKKYKIWSTPIPREFKQWNWIRIEKERILIPFLDKHVELSAIQINKKDTYYTIWFEVSGNINRDSFLKESKKMLKIFWLEKHCKFNTMQSYPTFIKSHYL